MTASAEPQRDLIRRPARRTALRGAELLRACLLPQVADGGWTGADASRARGLLNGIGVDTLVPLARYHGVSGLCHEPLRTLGAAPDSILAATRDDREHSVAQHLRVLWELSAIAPVLDLTGVPWAVLKGPALVEGAYGGLAGRAYRDLDLLVHPAGFGAVVAALEAAGWEPRDRNWAVLRREMRGEVHYRGRAGVEIDLHWDVVNMYRGRLRVDVEALLERANGRDLGGVRAPVLDPTDALLHLAVHAAISGGDRILWVKDIERAVAAGSIEWTELEARSHAWSVAAPVGLMLARSARFLGAAVPTGLANRLLGRSNRAAVAVVDRIAPWPAAVGRLADPGRLVARSIGQGLVGASAWFVVRSVKNLDPGQERAASAFTPGGGPADRDAFVRAVEATGRRYPPRAAPSGGTEGPGH